MTRAELRVTWPQALAWRLRRQLLDRRSDDPAADVVRRLGAVLSMDESLARIAVATRRADGDGGALAQAYRDGEVIKGFAFRGSRHYLAPDTAGAFLAIRCAGRQWELKSWQDYYRLAPADWPAFREAVREALADGPLTVPRLGERLAARPEYRHLRPVFDEGADTLVKPLSWQGDVCIAPTEGGRLTLQRLDTNPRWTGLRDLDDAGRYAVRHYLATYGPADDDRVQHWLGDGLSAGAKRVRRWLADLADDVVAVDVEGRVRSVLREDAESLVAARPSTSVRFLPGHDQWVMGPGTTQQLVVPAEHRTAVTRKANPVLAGGVVRGFWAVRGDRVVVDRDDAGALPDDALAAETDRLGRVLGRALDLEVRPARPTAST